MADDRESRAATSLQALFRGRRERRRHGDIVREAKERREAAGLTSPFVPTDDAAIEAFLDLAGVSDGDTVLDIGCGDARVVLGACAARGARGVGVEADPEVMARARRRVAAAGADVAARLTLVQAALDAPEAEAAVATATVVFVFMLPRDCERLAVRLRELARPGTRVVSYTFALWPEPDRVVAVRSPQTRLFLYTL